MNRTGVTAELGPRKSWVSSGQQWPNTLHHVDDKTLRSQVENNGHFFSGGVVGKSPAIFCSVT